MDSKETNVTKMNDDDRRKLAESLDQQLEDYVGKFEKRPYKNEFSEDSWEKEMQEHPAFRTEPFKEGEELPPLFQAMQQLKYDPAENSPDELAVNYKEDGNNNFKLKKYRWAVNSYTEGIKIENVSPEVKCQLYTNRAAANYRLGNFRQSLLDCTKALDHKENHVKAITRGAQCCQQLGHLDDTLEWCSRGLLINSKETLLLEIKSKVEKQKKIAERDSRKKAVQQKKITQIEEKLLKAIQERDIRIVKSATLDDDSENWLTLESLEPHHPAAMGARVHLGEHDIIIWPVLFVYPEYAQMDFIQKFSENEQFIYHLNAMFGTVDERPAWDSSNTYYPKNLKVYFEEESTTTLWEIDPVISLVDALRQPSYIVSGGTPNFFIMVRDSKFDKEFIKKYNSVRKIAIKLK